MKQVTENAKCTGCLACRAKCPNNCIDIATDDEGFPIPQIDESRCSNCGLCTLCCPENAKNDAPINNCRRVIGARLKDDDKLSKSASGGFFIGLASKTLETPGNAVFGCALDENLVARHICVTDINEAEALQSSKYVQSNVGNAYSQAKAFLSEGKSVLFSGTPCQVAGLYAYLGKNYDNLSTADLICHGVPSPLLFKRYTDRLTKKYSGKIVDVNLRDKHKFGWGVNTGVKIKTNTGTKNKVIPRQLDPYISSFLDGFIFRESCYSCRYSCGRRVSDFSLGDFWGVDNSHPEHYDARGVSVVLVNSEKGERILEEILDDFETFETTFDIAASRNSNLVRPSPRPALRNEAYKEIKNETTDIFDTIAYKITPKTKAVAYLRWITPSFAKKILKKTRGFIRRR